MVTAAVGGVSVLACGPACAAAEAKEGERKECLNRELNNQKCNCPNLTCKNHGICCQCVLNHRAQNNKPVCLR